MGGGGAKGEGPGGRGCFVVALGDGGGGFKEGKSHIHTFRALRPVGGRRRVSPNFC